MGWRVDVHVDAGTLRGALVEDVRRGLAAPPRWLPPKYFYDTAGAALFARITRLPEYYLTRAEYALIADHGAALLAEAAPLEVVEIGAGSPDKFAALLAAGRGATGVARYVPVDVDAGAVDAAARRLARTHPRLEVHGVVGDFERHLTRVPPPGGRRLVAFLGSTLGNLHPDARRALLADIRGLLGPGDSLLLGLDLVKDRARLEAAYDDRAGVTAAFNRNVLRVINRELDADFRVAAFRHRAVYDGAAARVEMHLVAEEAQEVAVPGAGLRLSIGAGESIWTESSYKFTRASTEAMLGQVGLRLARWVTGPDGAFALALARPE